MEISPSSLIPSDRQLHSLPFHGRQCQLLLRSAKNSIFNILTTQGILERSSQGFSPHIEIENGHLVDIQFQLGRPAGTFNGPTIEGFWILLAIARSQPILDFGEGMIVQGRIRRDRWVKHHQYLDWSLQIEVYHGNGWPSFSLRSKLK